MKRVVLILLGIVSLVLGVALIAGGGAVAALLGDHESISTEPARLQGQGVALVAENIRVDESSVPIPSGLGTLTLAVTSPDGRAVFAGTSKPDDLDTYLTGAPYDVVVDLTSGSKATTRPVPGTQQPPPPAAQPFWIVKSSGATATISSSLNPSAALVVMNADASPGVTADVVVTYRLAGAWTGAWIAVGAGVVLLLLGWLFLWRARVARRKRAAARAEAEAAAVAASAAAVSGATVLPSAGAPSEEVPAWAAAPVALSGAELEGPPTGAVVLEPSPDGAAAVVSATEPPVEPLPVPTAGWYPGAGGTAAAVAVAGLAASSAALERSSEPDGSDESDAPVPADVEGAVDGDAAPDVAGGTDLADDLPTTHDDAVDTWHDETAPVPVVEPRAASVDGDGIAPEDDPVYEELRSWFREEPGTPDAAAPDAG